MHKLLRSHRELPEQLAVRDARNVTFLQGSGNAKRIAIRDSECIKRLRNSFCVAAVFL
jgi:hypothetical protein